MIARGAVVAVIRDGLVVRRWLVARHRLLRQLLVLVPTTGSASASDVVVPSYSSRATGSDDPAPSVESMYCSRGRGPNENSGW